MARSYFKSPIRIRDGMDYVASNDATAASLINGSGVYTGELLQARIVSNLGKLTTANIDVVTSSLASGAIAANTMIQSSFTVSCNATDVLLAVLPPTSGITSGNNATGLGIGYAFVSAANTVAIGWINPSAVACSHVTGLYTFVFVRA